MGNHFKPEYVCELTMRHTFFMRWYLTGFPTFPPNDFCGHDRIANPILERLLYIHNLDKQIGQSAA